MNPPSIILVLDLYWNPLGKLGIQIALKGCSPDSYSGDAVGGIV
jgi:hypothetical protein